MTSQIDRASGGGGGGGGGGGTLSTTMKTVLGEPELLFAGNLVATTADTYVFVTDDDSARVILPADDDIAYVVIFHGSDDANEAEVGTTHWVPIKAFNDLTVAAAQTAANQVNTSDFFRGTATGSFTRRDFSWGLTAHPRDSLYLRQCGRRYYQWQLKHRSQGVCGRHGRGVCNRKWRRRGCWLHSSEG